MIDWTRVGELRADLGESFDDIVEVFLQEMEEGVARLDPAADARALAADLHFLKGAALNLGFLAFGTLCAEGEKRASGGDASGVDLAAVRALYEESRVDFLAGLAHRAA